MSRELCTHNSSFIPSTGIIGIDLNSVYPKTHANSTFTPSYFHAFTDWTDRQLQQ